MKQLIQLIKREYWENSSTFILLPAIFGGLVILAALCGLAVLSFAHGYTPTISSDINAASIPTGSISLALYGIGAPFVIILWVIVIYYFSNSLYTDRKDGSVLFWQSLPISQSQTLLSKVITGLLIAPFITWICIILVELALLIIASILLPVIGLGMLVPFLWHPGAISLSWLMMLVAVYIQGIWLLPIFGWFMLCSAFAKRAPLLYAIVPLLVIGLIESILDLNWHVLRFFTVRIEHVAATWHGFLHVLDKANDAHPVVLANGVFINVMPAGVSVSTFSIDMIIGVVVSAIFIGLAGWLRSRCYDFEK